MDPNSALPAASPSVIFREMDDGGVIFSTVEEVYYGLNAVGARVWSLLPPASRTLDDLLAAMTAQYADVDPAVIRADVVELLADLERNGLVTRAAADGASSPAR